MSIPLLIETQSEVRRLLIAGSELAAGDFRLKRLFPQMKKAGESVPVFARVADSMEKVIEPGSENISENLIELANIVNAVLYTQGKTGVEGILEEIEISGPGFPTDVPYRRLKPVIDALTSKGQGRLEIIREACREKIFKDLRLIYPLMHALGDTFSEIAELVSEILEELGTAVVPVLKSNFDFSGGKGCARRIDIISRLAGRTEKEFVFRALEEGTAEVKVSAVKALKDFPESESLLLELSRDRKKDIREASLFSLAYLDSEAAVKRLFEVFNSQEQASAVLPLKEGGSRKISLMLVGEAEKALEEVLKSERGFSLFGKKAEPIAQETINNLAVILDCMEGKKEGEVFSFLKKCLEHMGNLQQFKIDRFQVSGTEDTLAGIVGRNLVAFGTEESLAALDSVRGKFNNRLLKYSFEAALISKDPGYVFNHYAPYIKKGRKPYEGREVLEVMDSYAEFEKPFRFDEIDGSGNGSGEEYIKWDMRWLKVLVDIDETNLVCRLASKDEPRCIEYLLKKLESHKGFNDHELKYIITGLLQARYIGITEAVLGVLDYNFKQSGHYYNYYFNDFIKVLHLLPRESAARLEAFASKCDTEAARKLLEAARSIKEK